MKLKRPLLYDVDQVAQLWDKHPNSIYRDNARGRLPVAPIRVGAVFRWPRAAVNASVGLDPDADPFEPDREYLSRLPASVPAGRRLVHNSVRPVARRGGTRGSRFWLSEPGPALEICDCDWAPELGSHYRVDAASHDSVSSDASGSAAK